MLDNTEVDPTSNNTDTTVAVPASVDWGARAERWAGVRSSVVDVLGTSVHLLRAGDDHPADVEPPASGASGHGAGRPADPVLLVHGLGGAASNWLEVIPGLAKDRPVVAVDLPGFGRTQPPQTYAPRIGANARFLRALLDALGWRRAEIHGNSMGGMLIVKFAAWYPERVSRLVLSAPALTSDLRDLPRLDPLTFRQFAPFLLPGLGTYLLNRMYTRLSADELYAQSNAFLHGDPGKVSPEIAAVTLENISLAQQTPWRLPAFAVASSSLVRRVVGRRRIERAIAEVTAPTVVVWGDRDRLIGRPVMQRLRKLRPDWMLIELDGVGHVPMVEAPQRYLAAVRDAQGER